VKDDSGRCVLNANLTQASDTAEFVDSGIYGLRDSDGNDVGGAVWDTRVVGTRTLETRRRLDDRDVLYHVVPDLRSIVRKLSPSGRIPTIASE
jgi:hypothetical protein